MRRRQMIRCDGESAGSCLSECAFGTIGAGRRLARLGRDHATRRAQRLRSLDCLGSPWRGGRSEGPAAEARCFGAAMAHCAQSFSSILRSSQRRTGGGLWREIHTCILRNQGACAVGAVRQSLSPMGWSRAYRSAVRTGDHLVEDAAECPQIRCKTVNASVL
jgi:hypothetical protein